jgi:serine/threonine protein kinase
LYLEEVLEGQVVWIQGIPFRLASRSYLLRNLRTIACDLAQILDELTGTSPAIIHRDIKPRNLYFRVPESQVTLVDFGSAEHEGTRALTQPNVFPKLGTCKYIYTPFEQLTSQPSQDRRVDVFAAASVIFEILEGKPPYDNAVAGYQEALAYYKKREYEIWQTLQNRHPKLRRALFDALRVDPLERSRDLWDVAKALERTLSNE